MKREEFKNRFNNMKDRMRNEYESLKDNIEENINSSNFKDKFNKENIKNVLHKSGDVASNAFNVTYNKTKEFVNNMKFINVINNSEKFIKHGKYRFRLSIKDKMMKIDIYDKITNEFIASMDTPMSSCTQAMMIMYAYYYDDYDFSKFSENIGDVDNKKIKARFSINKRQDLN